MPAFLLLKKTLISIQYVKEVLTHFIILYNNSLYEIGQYFLDV